MVKSNFDQFDARRVSSLLALPSRTLDDEERILHRIWMGSALPPVACAAIEQWNCALAQVGDDVLPYRQTLWVWDEAQMKGDARFTKNTSIGRGGIGRYAVGSVELEVYSLRRLALEFLAPIFPLLETLQAKRYFVNLSDLFRLVILREFGGIYIDADTIPYRSAPIFLARPEVPDYVIPNGSRINWLNLYRDENGVLAAQRNNIAVGDMVMRITRNITALPREILLMQGSCPDARHYAALLQEATYGVWASEISQSFIAYSDVAERYCVLHDGSAQEVVAGLEGMRLVTDDLTNAAVPLTTKEQLSFDHCVTTLEARNWRLHHPLELENIANVFSLVEHPRIAYPPQLRSRIANCHYYSFLSHDERLDRVNALFGAYLVGKNAAHIEEDGYWRRTCGTPVPEPHAIVKGGLDVLTFLPGDAIAGEYKDRIAKLLFGTSYLEYCSFGNKLNLSFVELQRRQNIEPYLAQVRGMVNGDDDFVGFFIAGTMEEFDKVEAVSYYRDDMRAMDEAYNAFVARHAQPDDLYVSSLAIDEPWRGKRLFNTMFREIELLAHAKACKRIVLTVWENKSDALPIYLKKGFTKEGTFEFAHNVFFDHLHFLAYELEPALAHEEQY